MKHGGRVKGKRMKKDDRRHEAIAGSSKREKRQHNILKDERKEKR